MTAKYFALLTNVGAAKLANAAALGEKLEITAMAVGDANGTEPTPDPAQTKLVHECHRAPLNSLRVDPQNASQVIAEQVLAETVGGWWVREIGLYDTNGDLVAVGSCPPSYKPLMTEGSGREQIIRMILIVSSSDAVELKIDPSVVLATREYVDDAIEAHAKSRNHPDATTSAKGLVQLSSATNSTSEALAATPKAVKAAYDLANGKLSSVPDATISAKGIVQLSSATNSTSETLAATPKAVKAAYDRPGESGLGLGPVAKTDAYSNIAQFYRVSTGSTNKPPAVTGAVSAGVVCLPMDAAPSAGYLAVVGGNMAAYVGFSQKEADGVTWSRIYTDKYKPTATDAQAADWTNNFAARMGVARVLTGANKPTSPGVWAVENSTWTPVAWGTLYVTTNNSDLGVPSASGKYIHYLFIAHGATNKFFVATDVNGQFVGWEGYLPTKGGTLGGILKTNSEIQSTSANIWRGIQGDYGAMWHMDANASYYLLTNKGDQNGSFSSLRPLTINNSTGAVSIGTSLSVDSPNSIYKTGVNSYSDGGGSYHQTNGLVMQGAGDQVGEMYFLENIGKYASLGVHVKSGGRDAWYEFRNDGDIYANGTNVAPVGVIEAWPSDTPPQGWLICDGSGFNTAIFPSLARIFPSGQLPDMRGAFLRAKDNGKGVDPNRGVLSIQPGQAPASALGGRGWGDYAQRDTGYTVDTGTDNTGTYRVKQETEQQRETRPYNVAINYIVRAA
ncbi:phage tail-collar fiber domain-containing protein [Serratia marcescens]|uniref:phage tail-collar fiber domain-containing protein n=1 Tax=Serratia marcescens TaxID=615 RepID=UPI00217944D8|nr:phage tail protein [Serratia marcescens]CAI1967701.1 Phage tail fibre repeat [Serratia marcescens]